MDSILKIMSAAPEKKKSVCEDTWQEVNGEMKCKCPKQELPSVISDAAIERKYNVLVKNEKEKDKNEIMKKLLTQHFANSALNQCQTQPLNKMSIDPMQVVFKNEEKSTKPVKTSRIFSIPLHMVDRVKSDLYTDVRLGILEKLEGQDNHDTWLSPMIIVPKKTGKPRRVIDFTRLNRHCKRSVEHSSDTLRMSIAVPAPKTGKILFSTLDAWNGYHSIPLTELFWIPNGLGLLPL